MSVTLDQISFLAQGNKGYAMATNIASKVYGISKENIRDSFTDFVNVEHRLEFVAKVHGIEFINDSKATTVNATWFALESMIKPTIWIVGGQDKFNDYSGLTELVKRKVKSIVCLGEDNTKIIETFGPIYYKIFETKSAAEAVKTAYRLGEKGDAVLLSPACASFDLFDSYEDRGRQFKSAVRSL